ncbi:hypothetical protein MMPV_005753 [Pyropia vietnamensis]
MPAPGFVGALALNIAATPVLVALLVAPRRRARTGGGAGAAAGTTVTSAAAGTAAAGAALWALTAAAAVPPAALPPLVRVFGWVPLRAGTPAYAAGVLLASALDGSFGSSAGAGGDRNGSGGGRGSPTVAVAAATILVTAFGVLAVVFGGVPPPLLAASSGAYFWARWAAGGGALLPLLAAAVSAAVVLERSLPPPRAATAVSVSGTLPPEWAGMPARAALAVAAVVGSPPALAVARSSYALYTLQVPLRAVLSRERGGAEGGTPTAAVAVGDGVDVAALPFRVYWRYVTRGDSPGLVAESVGHAVRVLAGVTAAAATENGRGTPPRSFPLSANVPSWWVVEVVTDRPLPVLPPPATQLVVPPAYAPPSGVRFKARALQYAILTSPAGAVDWVVHLDEETRFDALTVAAILRHCSAEHYRVHAARSARYGRIGQGPIVYAGAGRGVTNWLTTLADSYRVADDCGRFRLQYAVGEAWVGMHGSYVVAPAVVEADVTFDLGPAASITEDAYFALAARSHGVRFGWVDAPMYEQSPFGVGDFLKQRARWLVGLLLVCASPRLPLRVRAVLTPFTLLWAALPGVYGAMLVVALLRVASRGAVGHAAGAGGIGGGGGGVGVNAAAVAAAYAIPALAAMPVWCYLYGYFATFSPRRRGVVAFWVLAYLQVVLIPVFAALEASATVYALARFHRLSTCFHVVEKERPDDSWGGPVETPAGLRGR